MYMCAYNVYPLCTELRLGRIMLTPKNLLGYYTAACKITRKDSNDPAPSILHIYYCIYAFSFFLFFFTIVTLFFFYFLTYS